MISLIKVYFTGHWFIFNLFKSILCIFYRSSASSDMANMLHNLNLWEQIRAFVELNSYCYSFLWINPWSKWLALFWHYRKKKCFMVFNISCLFSYVKIQLDVWNCWNIFLTLSFLAKKKEKKNPQNLRRH